MSPANAHFRFHEEHFPYVMVEVHGRVTDPAFADYLVQMTRILERSGKRFSVVDFTHAEPSFPRTLFDAQTAWNRKYEARMREVLLGVALIAPNPLARVIMRGVLTVADPGAPWRIVADRAAARAWAAEMFEKAGDLATAQRVRALPDA